jgi:hypothetical protein
MNLGSTTGDTVLPSRCDWALGSGTSRDQRGARATCGDDTATKGGRRRRAAAIAVQEGLTLTSLRALDSQRFPWKPVARSEWQRDAVERMRGSLQLTRRLGGRMEVSKSDATSSRAETLEARLG